MKRIGYSTNHQLEWSMAILPSSKNGLNLTLSITSVRTLTKYSILRNPDGTHDRIIIDLEEGPKFLISAKVKKGSMSFGIIDIRGVSIKSKVSLLFCFQNLKFSGHSRQFHQTRCLFDPTKTRKVADWWSRAGNIEYTSLLSEVLNLIIWLCLRLLSLMITWL